MTAEGDGRESGSRRRRDHRRRGDRQDQDERPAAQSGMPVAAQAPAPVQAELLPAESAAPVALAPVADPATTSIAAEVRDAPPVVQSTPVAAPVAAVPTHVAPPTPVPAYALPRVAMSLPPDTGLELVETRFQPAPLAEDAPVLTSRRTRPPKVKIADEPLQIVETHKGPPPAP
jgi:hypothetical protein